MKRDDLTATSWFTSRVLAFGFVLLGLILVFRPDWLGWTSLADRFGGETALVGLLAGIAFFVVARQTVQIHDLRVHAAGTLEALNDLLYGKDHRRDREAIEILLRSMRSEDSEVRQTAHRHLIRLTGQNFAEDADVWASWWKAHERTWSRRHGAASDDAAESDGGA